jgi:hypothetical protein
MKHKTWIVVGIIASTQLAAAGQGYGKLPDSGCPAKGQFGYEHFKQLKLLNGCTVAEGERHSTRIFRGGAPKPAGVSCLNSGFHVKAVFDLRSDGERGKEQASVEAEHMVYYSYPMATDKSVPSKTCKTAGMNATQCNRKSVTAAIDEMERLLAIDPQAEIYVHCARGEDRTGLVIGLYRVLKEGCPKQTARAEMSEFGYSAYPELKAVWEELTASAP